MYCTYSIEYSYVLRRRDLYSICRKRSNITYLFSYELVVELRDYVVLGFHLFLEVCHKLVCVVLGLQYFILTNHDKQKRTYVSEVGTALRSLRSLTQTVVSYVDVGYIQPKQPQ